MIFLVPIIELMATWFVEELLVIEAVLLLALCLSKRSSWFLLLLVVNALDEDQVGEDAATAE